MRAMDMPPPGWPGQSAFVEGNGYRVKLTIPTVLTLFRIALIPVL